MAFRTPPEVLLRQCLRYRSVSKIITKPSHSVSQVPCAAASYKTAVCVKIGAPLEVQHLPRPRKLNAREVLISTHALGINFADILTCKGQYQDRRKTPFTPGGEISGKVVEVGAEVSKVKIGDRVIALDFAKSGGASEVFVAPAEAVFPVPEHLSLVDAAATVVSYSTAMMALSRKAKLKQRERVLITAAAGATGLAAVDIARNLFDCEVIAVCGGVDKCNFLKERGANYTIDYTKENIRERVKEITKGRGVDVVMDQVGGDTLLDCIKSLGFEGRALTVGYAAGSIPNIPANQLLLKSSSLIGVFWGSYALSNPAAFMESITQVFEALSQKKIHPYVGNTFKLEQINEAFQFILDRKSVGKVVIKIREEDHPAVL
uniref:Enoyl reductase (ER) domain-containing protein n=1 Tax=Arion vulgaris TaxID=1028688 RepID=A0A0B6Z5Y9_9EUPU